MAREDIQATNPGGIQNYSAGQLQTPSLIEMDNVGRGGPNLLVRSGNTAALLGGWLGPASLALAVGGYLTVRGGFPWVGRLFDLFPPSVFAGSLLGLFAFVLAATDAFRWMTQPTAGRLGWTILGMVTGGFAALSAPVIFMTAMASIEC